MRNATTTTIAPTGTLSILAGCSGGIEPLYAVSFVRQVLDGERLVDVHPLFVERGAPGRLVLGRSNEASGRRGSVRGMDEVPAAVQRLFATAYDVAPEWHLRMQAAFQKHVHNAVSKTINFPHAATVDEVEAALPARPTARLQGRDRLSRRQSRRAGVVVRGDGAGAARVDGGAGKEVTRSVGGAGVRRADATLASGGVHACAWSAATRRCL